MYVSRLIFLSVAMSLSICTFPMLPNADAQDAASTETAHGGTAHGGHQHASPAPIKALIVDGQNNHVHWPKTTQMMKQYLEETGRFSVAIARTQFLFKGKLVDQFPLNDGKEYQDLKKAKSDPDFSPTFSDYDVIILNSGYGAAPWPEQTQKNFERYMREGGGLVVVHAADNCFPNWKAFNQMIGLGGWGNRNEKDGPYVYINNDGETIRDNSKGPGGAHGPQHEYSIRIRADHPITQGMPVQWKHTKDELYQTLRGPAENMTILATAYADPKYKGTDRHEPMVMTVDYEKGRTFHLALGHADYSFECVGMITLLLRGTEWAATGDVKQTPLPADFPTDDASSSRKFEMKKQEAVTSGS